MKNAGIFTEILIALSCLCSVVSASDIAMHPGYSIVTTTTIQRNSSKLAKFVAHKQSLGFDVQVVTEMDFGGGVGDAAAKNIRRWLQDHYISYNIKYVLLVGNPNPENGDIPMKMVWTTAWSEGIPSDLYYADLTGNWDWNGDGRYGMRPEDCGPGGVDTFYEVLVGRIPYYGFIEDLDAILQKTINYETQSGDAIEWRKNALLAIPNKSSVPEFSEGIKDNFLVPMGWAYHRLYDEDYGLVPPPETVPCTIENVIDVWSNGAFGLVVWWTHGGTHGASDVIDTSHVPYLNDNYPAFMVGLGCANATVEVDDNLAYSLLRHGAICTLAGTRGAGKMSWLGRDYVSMIVVEGLTCGEALSEVKTWQFGVGWNSLNVFNLYGDPSLRIIPSEPRSRRRFVNCRATPGGDGLSWETAYNDLQDALDEIVRLGMVREIWVTAGTYKPDRVTGDRTATFRLDKGIEIYGGFTGGETQLEQRDPAANVTVLSGDIGVEGDGSDNSYHVVTFKDTRVGALIDGFTITGGNANGAEDVDKNGGGMYNYLSNPTLTNCIFKGNSATDNGGAVYSCDKWKLLTLANCIFSDNMAGKGGAIYLNCRARMANCTFNGNSANWGGGIYNDDESYVILTDSILWANGDSSEMDETAQIHGLTQSVKYSCIEDADPDDASVYSGTGNIDDNPLFVSGKLGDYYLSHTDAGQNKNSPCVDAGSNAAANVGMNRLTTRTDEVADKGILEMSYHYSMPKPADLDGYVALASYPTPIDKATDVRLEPVLVWSAGYGALYHDVYIGTNANNVANADGSSPEFLGTVSNAIFAPGKLEINTKYYWRIDEVGAACATKGDIWSFTTDRGVAKEPSPPDAAEATSIDVVLGWLPGPTAVSHDVYLGTDFNDVNDANTFSDQYRGRQNSTIYDLNGLEYATTYYWRIDEVNGPDVWKGDVWQFTTCGPPNSYLVGWWKLDEGSGTAVLDWSGHGYDGQFRGDPQWVNGHDGYALKFDGVDDSVVSSFAQATWPAYTVALWVKADSLAQAPYKGIFSSHVPNTAGFQLDVDGGNPGNYRYHGSVDQVIGTVTTNWIHIAVAYNGTSATLYYNGNPVVTTNVTDSTFNQYAIGANRNVSHWFAGIIDDVRIYNRALSDSELWNIVMNTAYESILSYGPSPGNEEEDVSLYTVLKWLPGKWVADMNRHDVYLGTNFNDVNYANIFSDEYKGRQTFTRYDPNGLEYSTTYYWRIDEVNGPDIWKGDVWHFTTCGPPNSYLVGWWMFDEGNGDTAYDSAGDNHGYVYGVEWATGQIGGALSFDGVDDYVAMPDFKLITNTVTFVTWINGWKAGDWAGIVYSRSDVACGMDFGSNNTLHYTWNNNSEQTWGWEGGPQIPQNQWAMVALVIEPDKASAYVYTEAGGLQQGVNNIPHLQQTINDLKIGWDDHRGSRRFEGVIDDVRIYNRALYVEEIEELGVSD